MTALAAITAAALSLAGVVIGVRRDPTVWSRAHLADWASHQRQEDGL